MLDDIGLYDTIFAADTDREHTNGTLCSWSQAYNKLSELNKGDSPSDSDSSDLSKKMKSLLIRDSNESFLAWMIVCFVPLARKSFPTPGKKTLTPAGTAARDGIKADNKICKIVDDAVHNLQDVILMKNEFSRHDVDVSSPLKRKPSNVSRVVQGLAIRRWGPHWRSCVIFALLTEVAEQNGESQILAILEDYGAWLLNIEEFGLLDVDKLKPIIDGKQVFEAVGSSRGGPWVRKALDIAMAWQLRHPEITDPTGAIEEIISRKREIGIP